MGLTAIVLTNKNPKNISKTLESVSFADEVLVSIPKSQPISDFSAERNLGLARAKHNWVLFVDDDEIVSRSLATEILSAIKSNKYSGYHIRRLDRYHGQILQHGETGSMRIIRLAKKSAGKFRRSVHETWRIDGLVGQLKHVLVHERGELVEPFITRMTFYGPLDAKQLTKEGKTFSLTRLLLNPLGKFILNYKLKLGFLDGYLGLFHSYLMSVQSLTVRVFQWSRS